MVGGGGGGEHVPFVLICSWVQIRKDIVCSYRPVGRGWGGGGGGGGGYRAEGIVTACHLTFAGPK